MDFIMDCTELNNIIDNGEDSLNQFKENFDNLDKLSIEISAFANSEGGRIFVGISDKGEIVGLSRENIHRLNQWISNAATSKIEPPVYVKTEILKCDERRILIVHIPRGDNKPYAFKKTEFWVKIGADKRRATREQLFRLMQSSNILFADELETSAEIGAIDLEYLDRFYRKVYQEKLANHGLPLQKLLENLKLMSGENLTLAGLLLFGSHPEKTKPQFTVKATYFDGDDISVEWFRDSENILGKLLEQFVAGKTFVKRNLKRIQAGRNFNAPPILEIPEAAFSEAIANAIIHRDYFINAPIFIYMFDSRIEIISPGVLPNTVTEENIKYGIHIERNPTILTFLEKEQDFHYSGRGSGVPRMIAACEKQGIKIKLINDQDKQQFKVVFFRPR